MGHFAKVLDGKVIKVIVAEQEFIDTFIDNSPGEWIKTSYNTRAGKHWESDNTTESADQSKALRKNFAGVGMIYDKTRDAFYIEKPYASFTLNETTCIWECPIDMPTVVNDGADPVVYMWYMIWDEELYQSDNTKGWTATKKNLDGSANADTATYDWNGTSWVAR